MTDTELFAEYTPAYRARTYLTGLTAAFADGTRPELDSARCGAGEFPAEFARLATSWTRCLDAAQVINDRYYEDWNAAGGPLTVIAPAVRDKALSELRVVWMAVCRTYVAETLDRDRIPFDCPFCGVHVDPEGWHSDEIDADRCPNCMCILWMNDTETDWL